jgi:DNA-binding NarL/FixJ family response regulator
MNVDRAVHVVLVSSSKFFREGIRRILKNEEDLKIVAEGSDLKEIEGSFIQIKPDLLFIDNRIPNADNKKLLDSLTKISPCTRVILLDDHPKRVSDSPNVVYITKETDSSELIRILRGGDPDETSTKRPLHVDRKRRALTKRELKILKLVGSGLSNKQAAKRLSISEKTVKAHLTSIYKKLKIRSRYELMTYNRRRLNGRYRRGISVSV